MGVGHTLLEATNSDQLPKDVTADDNIILYLLVHFKGREVWNDLVPLIDEVVNRFGSVTVWEEV